MENFVERRPDQNPVNGNVVDITAENFEAVIIEKSKQQLIVIGFWTARDETCVQLMSQIEASVAGADVTFAKIDVDTQSQVAMQFGIQSVPTVALFKDVKPVDSFVGTKTPDELEAFFAPHMPKEQDILLANANELLASEDYAAAYPLAKKAYQLDPSRVDIQLTFAEACVHTGKLTDAEQLLGSIKMVDQDSRYHSAIAALELAQTASESPEIKALQAQLEQNPDDNELKIKLAVQFNQNNRNDEALTLLYGVLAKDMAFGDAKKLFLDMLSTLPDGDELASKYRRKLYSLMY